jgi:hypothetical protein
MILNVPVVSVRKSGFGGLEVACWPLVPKFADLSGRKNPQHAFLRRGSKAVGPMSQILRHVQDHFNGVDVTIVGKLTGHFSPTVPAFCC